MSQKRISRELILFDESIKKHKLNFSISQIGYEPTINKVGLFSKNNVLLLEIILNTSYPFKAPNLIIPSVNKRYTNPETYYFDYTYTKYAMWCSKIIKQPNNRLSSIDYNEKECNEKLLNAYIFTYIRNPLASKFLSFIPSNTTCLCCQSLTCGHKWSPSCKIFDLCIEFLSIKTFETYLKPQTYRQITKIFNNDRWIIPEEIQLHILTFIAEEP